MQDLTTSNGSKAWPGRFLFKVLLACDSDCCVVQVGNAKLEKGHSLPNCALFQAFFVLFFKAGISGLFLAGVQHFSRNQKLFVSMSRKRRGTSPKMRLRGLQLCFWTVWSLMETKRKKKKPGLKKRHTFCKLKPASAARPCCPQTTLSKPNNSWMNQGWCDGLLSVASKIQILLFSRLIKKVVI